MSGTVNMTFTVNDKGAPIIKIIHDKNSQDIAEKLMAVFLKGGKSNSNNLALEAGLEFSDGKAEYTIKVLGT
jgi:hypothetical protein